MASSQNQSTLIPSDKTQGASATPPVLKETKVADVKRKAEAQSWLAIFSGRLQEVSNAVKELYAAVPIINKKLDAIFELQKGVLDIVNKLLEVLNKKTGIFQVAASDQQAKSKQQEKAPQQADDLPADLKDLCKEDREKLVRCPGGIKLRHFFPDKSVWKQNISLLAEEDYEKEGFKYMEEQGLKMPGRFANQSPRIAFNQWREAGGEYWVVDFELLSTEKRDR